jgi:hypothetical protein
VFLCHPQEKEDVRGDMSQMYLTQRQVRQPKGVDVVQEECEASAWEVLGPFGEYFAAGIRWESLGHPGRIPFGERRGCEEMA